MCEDATTGFHRIEGFTIRHDAKARKDYAYVDTSNTNRTTGDDEKSIKLNGDEWRAVYRMPPDEGGESNRACDGWSMVVCKPNPRAGEIFHTVVYVRWFVPDSGGYLVAVGDKVSHPSRHVPL